MGGRSFAQMLRDRMAKRGWYDTPGYWDMKAEAYEGLARSNWPSNTYNRHWHARQMALLDRALGDVTGLSIADVACGTGRASRHLASKGAKVTGLDFAPRTLEAARRETASDALPVDYRLYDAHQPPPDALRLRFDVVLTISCLAMACADAEAFETMVGNIGGLLKPNGRLLLLEPIHSSRLLTRILKMGADEWIRRVQGQGFALLERLPMGFVPARLMLAFRELPPGVVEPLFWAGERILDRSKIAARFSDYTCLLFQRSCDGHA